MFAGNIIAETPKIYSEKQPLVIDNIYITNNLTDLGAESSFTCEEDQKIYEQIDKCITKCEDCVYQDNGCWKCVDSEENDKDKNKKSANNSWFQKIKNQFKQVFVAIGNFVKRIFNKPEPQPQKEEQQEAAKKVLAYHESKDNKDIEKPTNEEVEGSLFHAFKNAQGFPDLIRLRALMMIYCNDLANGDYKKEKECNERFMALFRKKGDELKENLIADINPQKGDAENYKKITELNSLLMAGETPSGKGVWFSTDNIQKVRQELRQKARIWFKAALEDIKLEEIYDWYYIAKAYTTARGEGEGTMKGSYPLELLRERVEILIIKRLVNLDICNPDQQKLKKIQDLLKWIPSIKKETPIIKETVRKNIEEGNIEKAYKELYEIVVKKYPEKKAELPLPDSCKKEAKKQAETKGFEEENTTTSEDTEPLDSPEEDLSLKDCNLEVYQKEIVGWDFTINNCEESYTQGLACFNHCGWDPPVYLEETEQEVVCYETMEGVINNDLIIPCYPRPEPDSGVIQCINDCLNQ